MWKTLAALALVLGMAACAPGTIGGAGSGIYRIKASDTARIQFRVLDSVNALRSASGAVPLELDSLLNAAAATHSRDMALQNRPWHFGSDGSSPLERVERVGYPGILIGENISETYENESETLAAWMEQSDTRNVVLAPAARKLGFSWFQEPSGKIWWTMVTGS
ncbi:MAG: CAP domain-containing protein [Pseudomonadota bacterium]